ncbi:formate/nitrite transporter family protein [Anaeromyxobacter paludicola]|uniref:Transporter n=1 Tax=Anaeromyxobacter paludicola TaxID=2918171 RepID=A0ABM7XFA8_9BACT|nr:formate/nitrite transporter family protein [Anaeromyxobacter paludicola]BDG10546.1 hypothetical protein AMPC_36590 [Anaeromyxobacter paludicola]
MAEKGPVEAPTVEISRGERERAAERKAIGPLVVHEAIRIEGAEELERPVPALAWSAVAAGLSMGFSLVAEGLLRHGLPDAPWRPLVSRLGYSIGFLVVVLGRQQLFTENTLTVMLPFLDRPTLPTFGRVARLWAVVLAGNVVGALGFAWLCGRGDVFPADVRQVFAQMAREAVAPGFGTLLLRGIYGGWLIALMIWLLPAAENAKLFVVIIVTWLVGVGSFAHAVAGSVEALYLVTSGELSPGAYLGGFLLPAFLGNSIGGVSLVAALNHAQVRAGAARAA